MFDYVFSFLSLFLDLKYTPTCLLSNSKAVHFDIARIQKYNLILKKSKQWCTLEEQNAILLEM